MYYSLFFLSFFPQFEKYIPGHIVTLRLLGGQEDRDTQ